IRDFHVTGVQTCALPISLAPEFSDEKGRKVIFDSLSRAPKQQDAVIAFLQLKKQREDITRQDVLEASACGSSAISALIEKGFFSTYEKVVSRLNGADVTLDREFKLSIAQNEALQEIM